MARHGSEVRLDSGAKPKLTKIRKDGWTAAKRRRFIEALAATCNVARAARVVRMSVTGVYFLRRRSAAFRAEWAAALAEGYAKLELMLLDRAMNGTVKTVTRANGAIDRTHDYPNAMAMQLLRLHKASAAEAEAVHDPVDIDEVRQRIARKLAGLRRRMESEAARTAVPPLGPSISRPGED